MEIDMCVHTGPEPLRDEFLNVVSHEFKTPLTILKLQTQHLKKCLVREGLDDDVAILAQMEAQIQRLERLNAVLLDISKNISCKRLTG